MHDGHAVTAPFEGQAGQPRDSFGTEHLACAGGRLADEARTQLLGQVLFVQSLVGVAEHRGPAQLAQPVDHLDRMRPAQRKVAAEDDRIRPSLLQVGEHRLESRQVAVNVGHDGQSHRTSTLLVSFAGCGR